MNRSARVGLSFRIAATGLIGAAIGTGLAVVGLGLWGYVVAAALTAPLVQWVLQ